MSMIKLTPLGGLYEFGNQSYLYRLDGTNILVDAGAFFEDEQRDLVNTRLMPDYNVLEKIGKLDAILITHNHEDHIGGLTYLLQKFPKTPVYCTPFVAENIRIRARVEGLNIPNLGERIHKVGGYCPETIRNFRVEFLPVDHSVPDASMIYIKTPQGNILHTGDWRFDREDKDLKKRLHEIGREGLLALVADSTGINNTRDDLYSEEQVYDGLEKIILKNKNKYKSFIFTTFSTHVERVASICRLAKKYTNKNPSFIGTSLLINQIPAINKKMLPIRSIDMAKEIIPNNSFYITSGSQAEPGSFLMKVVMQERFIEKTACIIMSASEIPGRREKIHQMIEALEAQGHKVIRNDKENLTHISGHATRSDMERLIVWTNPRFYFPVHGEGCHLRAASDLARPLVEQVVCFDKVGDTASFAKNVKDVLIQEDLLCKKIEVQQRFDKMALKELLREQKQRH